MITFTAENVSPSLLEVFQRLAIESGTPFLVKQTIENQKLVIKNDKPNNLEEALLALSSLDLDLEDDFFDMPEQPMREIDWSE
ncbi:hypothetical protein [Moraxella oblonga]|uniref:hypothetical protein n=1 Tax=Moraxella oblonga TaxID=200413 RepID=UPI00082CEF37|nr:hypothetical protein [Moraxella oblonga]